MPTALRTLPTGREKAAIDEEATVIIVNSERGVWCEHHGDFVLSLTVAILAGIKICKHQYSPTPTQHFGYQIIKATAPRNWHFPSNLTLGEGKG